MINNMALQQIASVGPELEYLNDTDAAKSSRIIVSHPFVNVGPVGRSIIRRKGDLLGECFLNVTLNSPRPPDDPYDILERVEFLIGGSIIESFSGRSLAALATFDLRARASVLGRVVVLPLRLSTLDLPMISLGFHEVVVVVETREIGIDIESMSLDVEFVVLGYENKKSAASQSHHAMRVHPKTSAIFRCNRGDLKEFDIDLLPWLDGVAVRDLIVEVRPMNSIRPDHEFMNSRIEEISILLGEHELLRLSAAMASRAIPKYKYMIDEFDKERFMYYLSFDHDPTTPIGTAMLRMHANDPVLRILFDKPCDECDIIITARTFNVLYVAAGMGGLKFPVPDPGCRILYEKIRDSRLDIIDGFLTPTECDKLRMRILEKYMTRNQYIGCTWSQEDDYTRELIKKATRRMMTNVEVLPNSKVTYGVYRQGNNVDTSLQGNRSLLVYLNDVIEGGRTIFYDSRGKTVSSHTPRMGVGVLLGVGMNHKTEVVTEGHFKVIITCDIHEV